jgi:hypothetical protein
VKGKQRQPDVSPSAWYVEKKESGEWEECHCHGEGAMWDGLEGMARNGTRRALTDKK